MPNKTYDKVQLRVKFTQASDRANIGNSDTNGENIAISFGKLSKWYEALVPTGGSSGQFLGWNSDGTAKWVSNPNSDTKVKNTYGTANTYYPAGMTQTSTTTTTQVADTSFKFIGATGTTSEIGKAQLVLGNNITAGTNGNKQGSLVIYGSTAYAHTLIADSSIPTQNRTLYLPDKDGTLAVVGDIPNLYAGSNSTGGSALTVYGTLTNPSGQTSYAIPFHTDISSGDKSLLNNDGIVYTCKQGTASATGFGIIELGNAIDEGTAGNKYGLIRLYSRQGGGKYVQLYPATKLTANRNIMFPNAAGTVALTTDIPTVNDASLTLKGDGTDVVVFTANSASDKSLNITAGSNVTITPTAAGSNGAGTIQIASSHPTITKSADTTSTASPTHGGTFTTVDSVTRDANGHVTKINTKTVTLPADNDYRVKQENTTTSAEYRLLFSNSANDTTENAAISRKGTNLRYNPSTKSLYAGYYGSDPNITSRLTSLNFTNSGAGTGRTKVRFDLVTTSLTTGAPPAESGKNSSGHVTTYSWDSNIDVMTQIYIPNGDHVGSSYGPQPLMIRGDDSGTWLDWRGIATFSQSSGSITSGQVVITDGTLGLVKASGYTIAKSVPSDAVFTDTKVTQTNTTTSADYRVLLSGNANDTTETTTGRKSVNLKFNPSTGVLSASSGVTTKTITRSALKGMLTGSGTAAQDKGSGVSPRYFPAKWTFDTGLTAANGDVFIIKLPTAGHSYGVFLSIDNGANYYPISVNGTSKLTTHYGNGYSIAVMFKSDGSTADVFPLAGGNSRSTVTGGCWQVLNYYDSGNSNTYDRNRYNANIKAGSSALVAGNIIVGKDGVFNHLKSGGAFDISYPILYLNAAVAASATTTDTYDILHITITTTQSITLTAYKPVFIKGALSGTIFTPVSATPLTQTVPTTDDGYVYIYLGNATSTTTMYLQERHPIYAFKNNAFGEIVHTASNANNIATTVTPGSSSELINYGVIFAVDPSISEFNVARKNNDFRIQLQDGTASTAGWASLILGNATSSGTAGNKEGRIVLYSTSTSYHKIIGDATTSIYDHTLPNISGTISMLDKNGTNYWGLVAGNSKTDWVRTTQSGIIPYQNGGAGSGHSSLGTSAWYFAHAYIDTVHGSLDGNAATATKATQDESGNNIKATYAASFSISDHTITLKNKNGTSLGTVTVPDDDTWIAMVGATSSANGSVGYVNAVPPKDGYNTKYLRADGTWATPPGTYSHPTYTRTDTTSTASPAHGGTFTAIDSVTATNGHVTAVNVKTITLPAQYVHPGKTQTDTTSTASPAHGGTFTVVDSVTRDTSGHVSGINVKTVTLPSDQNTDTKVKVTANTTTKGYLIASTTSPNGTAVEGIADTGVYLDTTAGGLCATNVKASSTVCANTANSNSAGGVALYSTDPEAYGVMFRGTSNSGKHGYVQSDWATYFTMNENGTTRGWVFRRGTTNVASISGAGNAVFNGSVTVGGNSANTSGCRMEYNTSTQSLDFVFA